MVRSYQSPNPLTSGDDGRAERAGAILTCANIPGRHHRSSENDLLFRFRRSPPTPPDEASAGGASVRRALVARRRSLPWSNRSILLVSLGLALAMLPLWLDPLTLSEVAGQVPLASPNPTGMGLSTPGRADSPAGPSPAQTLIATDDFERSVFGEWGSADTGGRYTILGGGTPSVEESLAIVRLRPGDAGSATLSQLAVTDVALEYSFSVDRLPTDGELVTFALVRVSPNGAAYRVALHLTAAGSVYAAVETLIDGRLRTLGEPVVLPIARDAAPPALHVQVVAQGTDPTTLRLRAWADSQTDPVAWQVSVIDWSGVLQHDGAVGLGWQLDSSTSDGFALAFNDFVAWRLAGANQ